MTLWRQCGFSNAVVQILDAHEVEYAAYNVLEDPELREGVKKFRQCSPFAMAPCEGRANWHGGANLSVLWQ